LSTGHPAERHEVPDGFGRALVARAVHQQDVAEHPLTEDLPYHVEALLPGRTDQGEHQVAVEDDASDVHRHGRRCPA